MSLGGWIMNHSSLARTLFGQSRRTEIADMAMHEAERDLEAKQAKLDRDIYASVRITSALGASRQREVTKTWK